MASAFETLRGGDVVIDFYVSTNAGTGTSTDTVTLTVLPRDTDNILGINTMVLQSASTGGISPYWPAGNGTTLGAGMAPLVMRVMFQAIN